MNVPMEWSTRGLCNRDASQAFQLAVHLLEKVDRRVPRAAACRVVVARDHGARGHELEGPVHVRVEVTVPSRPPVLAVRHADEGWPGEGVVSAVHEAFRRVLAQLDGPSHHRPPRRHGSDRRPLWLPR
jgi:hypothetical protein